MSKYQIRAKAFMTLVHCPDGSAFHRVVIPRGGISSNHPVKTAKYMTQVLTNNGQHHTTFAEATRGLPNSVRRLPRGHEGRYVIKLRADYGVDGNDDPKFTTTVRCLKSMPVTQPYHCSPRYWATAFKKIQTYLDLVRTDIVHHVNRLLVPELKRLELETIMVGKMRARVIAMPGSEQIVTVESGFGGLSVGFITREQLHNLDHANPDHAEELYFCYEYIADAYHAIADWFVFGVRPNTIQHLLETQHLDPALAERLKFNIYDERSPSSKLEPYPVEHGGCRTQMFASQLGDDQLPEGAKLTDQYSGMGPVVKVEGEDA